MSQLWEYIKIAIMNLKSNKGRSVLTMLGIIIGISSVIMVISIGGGVKNQVNKELEDYAGGFLYVGINQNSEQLIEFTEEDFDLIKERIPHVTGVTPDYYYKGTVTTSKGSFDAGIEGGTESLEWIYKNPIKYGHYFTEGDYLSANPVCVISEPDAIKLFGTANVLGMELEATMDGVAQDMTIIGVREAPAASTLGLSDNSNVVVEMPLTLFGDKYGWYVESFNACYIIADSTRTATEVAKKSIALLEAKYNVRGENCFVLSDFNDEMSSFNEILSIITLFVVFVAAISLLVGGIGVMNIMLVSVTERTREIGIRKSLGARTASILAQFLSESAIISLTGGIIGILFGIVCSVLICAVLGFSVSISVGTVIGATMFSSAVGIFFGIYPAKRAAKLSPIEALRHE